MVVGIVTTLNFIVFFTPGQLSPFSIHIIKWQLSANSINILMEENFGFVRKCIPIACGRCVGLYQLTHLRTYAACTGENFIHWLYASCDFRYRWYQNYTLGHFSVWFTKLKHDATGWYHSSDLGPQENKNIWLWNYIDFVPGYLDRW